MARKSQSPHRPRIDLFHAGGKEAEVEEVFRRILASGTSLDKVEIGCASPGYDTLIREKALRLEWPATSARTADRVHARAAPSWLL